MSILAPGETSGITRDDALTGAAIFNEETRRSMQAGHLPLDDQSAIPIIDLVIDKVVGEGPLEVTDLISQPRPPRSAPITRRCRTERPWS